jgi:hypothetical protein
MNGTDLLTLATTCGIVGYGAFLLWFSLKVAHRPAPRARRGEKR